MIELDGSMGEGGGQILRTALALSALTHKPFSIVNIRANRPKPGLRPQHLEAVKAAMRICAARVEGAAENSTALRFDPGPVAPGQYRFEIHTAGSAPMLLQAIYLPLAFAPGESRVEIRGGTHVPWSPPYHFLERQWAPWLLKLGLRVDMKLQRAGFFPQGGGEMQATIKQVRSTAPTEQAPPTAGPTKQVRSTAPTEQARSTAPFKPATALKPLRCVERGKLKEIVLLSAACNLPSHIAERQTKRLLSRLSDLGVEPRVEMPPIPAQGKGTFVLLTARYENGQGCYSALGAIGKPAETVADEAAEALLSYIRSDAVMDEHLADQILLPLSLASGESEFTTPVVTGHLLTNAEVIRRFLPADIRITGAEGEPGRVSVSGVSA